MAEKKYRLSRKIKTMMLGLEYGCPYMGMDPSVGSLKSKNQGLADMFEKDSKSKFALEDGLSNKINN